MKNTEIIEAMREKLSVPVGRHVYGVLGTYRQLETFAGKLHQAKTAEGSRFPKPVNVNKSLLEAIPDTEFRTLAQDEAKFPEPVCKHVSDAFENFLRAEFRKPDVLVLGNLEMLFAYRVDFSDLRALATDGSRVVLLLPGRRSGGRVILFHEAAECERILPTGLVAEEHLWEITE